MVGDLSRLPAPLQAASLTASRRPMSEAVDEHLDNAFASLDDLTVRELHATAKVLERRRDALAKFSSIEHLRNVADARGQAGAPMFPASTFGSTSPVPTRSSPRRSRTLRRPSGATSVMRCASCLRKGRHSRASSPLTHTPQRGLEPVDRLRALPPRRARTSARRSPSGRPPR